MRASQDDIARLIKLIGLCARRLKAARGSRDGMSPSLRVILECLGEQGPQTVPHMAEVNGVSRQHIQKHVDLLIGSGHVELRRNPTHRRSAIVALTEKGAAVFAEIQRQEREFQAGLASGLDGAGMAQALAKLQALADRIERLP